MVHPPISGGERGRRKPPHPCLDRFSTERSACRSSRTVMQIAMVGANYTGRRRDQLRRHGRLEEARADRNSIAKAPRRVRETGISAEFGEQLFKQILGFGEYGFPESHAASFALIVYSSAWPKVHYPAAFACSLLNAIDGVLQPLVDHQRCPAARHHRVARVRREECVDSTLDSGTPAVRPGDLAPCHRPHGRCSRIVNGSNRVRRPSLVRGIRGECGDSHRRARE